MSKTFGKGREWLNPISSSDTGAIQWWVATDGYGSTNASFTVWDCGRKIDLSFDVWNNKDYKERVKKVDKLIHHLEKMKAALELAEERRIEDQEKRKEKKRQKNYI